MAQPPDQDWQMRFRGTDVVVMPADAVITLGSTHTVQLWVYPERRGYAILVERFLDNPDSDPSFSVRMFLDDAGHVGWGETTGAPGSQMTSTTAEVIPLKQWTHIAATNDGSPQRIYLNGTQVRQFRSPGAPGVSGQPIHVGAALRPPGGTNPGFAYNGFVGMLRQFGLWNRALSQAEIRAAMTTRFDGHESGLAGFWPMDDGPGYSFRDLTAAGKTASLVYPTRVMYVNGNQNNTSTSQYWPLWFRPAVFAASLFVWTEQTQGPTESGTGTLFPIDFDSDGDLDLVGVGFWNPNVPYTTLKSYRNDGKGGFSDATKEVFGPEPIPTLGPNRGIVSDLNHDGRADFVLPDYGSDYFCCDPVPGGVRVFIQTAEGRLVNESASRVPAIYNKTHDNDGADIDGDGNVDLYLADIRLQPAPPYFRMSLLMNDGAGHFAVDNSRLPKSLAKMVTYASRFLDANGDGWPDLFVTLGGSDTDRLFLNDGKGSFQEMVPGALPPKIGGANGSTRRAVVGDLNRDGYPDLVLSAENYSHQGFQVLINRGDGTFDDRTLDWLPDPVVQRSSLRADRVDLSGEMLLQDFNGDGYPELLIQWGQDSRLYMNNGLRLVDTSSFLPFLTTGQFAVGDFDGDGRPDVVYAERDNASKAVLVVGLNKADYAPPVPAPDPGLPVFGPVAIHNEASGSSETLAPGTRIRILGKNLGPAETVAVTEVSGAVLPVSLAEVTVTFDKTPARLISVSATEIVAVVPFAVSGQWISTVRVSYQDRVSEPVNVFIRNSVPMVYAKVSPGQSVGINYWTPDVWKVNGSERVKVTGPNQIHWGDRVALRATGLGQGQQALTDETLTQTQDFTPAAAMPVNLGAPWGKYQALAPVSMTYAPEGLAGVVEVVVDLPAAPPPDSGSQFFVLENNLVFSRAMLWPF